MTPRPTSPCLAGRDRRRRRAVLALAPAASAAFKPLFTATSAGDTSRSATSQSAANDGAASLAFYAPKGYAAKLPRPRAGTVVGTATGTAIAADIRNSTMPLTGTIRVASPTAPLGDRHGDDVGDAAKACAGTSKLAAVWSLTLDVFNEAIPLAIAVQKLDSGPMAGALVAVDLPARRPTSRPGRAGRAPLGMKIVHLSLRLTNAFAVPAGHARLASQGDAVHARHRAAERGGRRRGRGSSTPRRSSSRSRRRPPATGTRTSRAGSPSPARESPAAPCGSSPPASRSALRRRTPPAPSRPRCALTTAPVTLIANGRGAGEVRGVRKPCVRAASVHDVDRRRVPRDRARAGRSS